MVKTDEELYNDFLKGNNFAFEEIVERHRINMIYFVYTYTKDLAIAEDIVQDSFVYLLMNKKQYNFTYKLKNYLFMIAKSRAINHIKKVKKEISINDNFDEQFNCEVSNSINLTENIIQKEKLKEINKVIQKLKPEYKSVLYLYEFEGLNTFDISQILNKSVIQVRSLIYNSKKTLRKLLKEEGISYEE